MVDIMSQTYLYFAGKTERGKGLKQKALLFTCFGAKGMHRKYASQLNFDLTLSIDSKAILYTHKNFNRWKNRNVSEEQDILLTPPPRKETKGNTQLPLGSCGLFEVLVTLEILKSTDTRGGKDL